MFRVGDRVRFATCHGIGQVVEAPHEGCCGLVRVRWESGLLQWYGMDSPFLERVEPEPQFDAAEFEQFAAEYREHFEQTALTYKLPSEKYDHTVDWRSRIWFAIDLETCASIVIGPWRHVLNESCIAPDAASVESECMLPHQLDTWLGNGIERCVLIEPLTARRYAWWSKASVALIDPPQVTLCQ